MGPLLINLVVGATIIVIVFDAAIAAWLAWVAAKKSTHAALDRPGAQKSGILWAISVVVPAFNEEKDICTTVHAILDSHYVGPLEIIVVDDGSSDSTLRVLREEFPLLDCDRKPIANCPANLVKSVLCCRISGRDLIVIHKANGGKADALNAGINYASGGFICTIDADTLLERDAIAILHQEMLRNDKVVAAGGVIGVANGKVGSNRELIQVRRFKPILVALQVLEYARAFGIGRIAASRLGLLTLISGAFGMFDRRVLVELGGYRRDTVGEDFELVLRIHRHMLTSKRHYEVAFVPSAIAWTEVPDTLGDLAVQRSRWQRGAIQSFVAHRDMISKIKFGRLGFVGVGRIAIGDILIPIAYVFSMAIIAFGLVTGSVSALLILGLLIFLGLVSFFNDLHAVRIMSTYLPSESLTFDIGRLAFLTILDVLLFRHLLFLFRLYGFWQQMINPRAWGSIARRGFRLT